jgi:hypothetical protein
MWSAQPRALRIAISAVVLVLALLVLAQIVLPSIAASRIRSRVGRYGSVKSVKVSAWPAIKLLWGDADSVSVHVAGLTVSPQRAAGLLSEGNGVAHLDLSADSLKVGPLQMTGATLHKRGDELSAEASTTQAAAQAALPAGLSAELIGSEAGKVEVRATGGLFGLQASLDAVAEAVSGKLIAHPVGALLEGFRITIFANPHIYVEGIAASTEASTPLTYRLSINASLR